MDTSHLASRIFRMYDSNDDGHIDFKEFMIILYIICNGPMEKCLEQIFHIFDIADNGTVSIEELSCVIRYLFQMFLNNEQDKGAEEALAIQAFKEMDANDDGKVTKEEFVMACLNDDTISQMLARKLIDVNLTVLPAHA